MDSTILTLTDPLRAGAELIYLPGLVVLRTSDVIITNKNDSASSEQVKELEKNSVGVNPKATAIHAESPVWAESPQVIEGKRVLCIEDGPTLIHGEMKFGAAVVAAQNYKAKEIIDPRPFTTGELIRTFKKYPGIGT